MKTTTLLAVVIFGNVYCDGEHSKYEQEMKENLPPIYAIDYSRCTNETNGRYCLAHAYLKPIGEKPPFWKLVEERKKLKTYFDRTSVDRAICLPRSIKDGDVKMAVDKILTGEFSKYNVTHDIYLLDCKVEHPPVSNIMKFLGLVTVLYTVLVVYATVYDRYFRNTKTNVSKLEEWILFFSITSNWNMMVNRKKTNSDYRNLEFFEGIRFYNMSLVIACHVGLTWSMVWLRNPEYAENTYNSWSLLISGPAFYLVQTFFLISSWLVTNQILEIHKSNGKFTIKDCAILLFNRVMRYVPTLLVLILGLVSPLPISPFCEGTLIFDFIGNNQKGCFDNWWMTLFHVNNLAEMHEICSAGTWYISIDSQYYLLTIVILYIILKKNLNPIKTLTVLILVALGFHTYMNYSKNLTSLEWMDIEKFKRHNFLKDHVAMVTQYFSFYSSWATSLIGLCIGMVYFHTKENKKIQPYEKVLFSTAFLTLPVLALLLTEYTLGPSLAGSIVSALMKPIWSLGIGLGFLGLARNAMPGSRIKSVCLNKYAVLMGNFSYSTYIVHFQIVFLKTLNEMTEMNFYTMIRNFLLDFTLSWIAGIAFALYIEQPGMNVLKKFLPVVKKQKAKVNGSEVKNGTTRRNGFDDAVNNNFKNK